MLSLHAAAIDGRLAKFHAARRRINDATKKLFQ
jgi:hypothetical protein